MEDQPRETESTIEKPWMKSFGGLSHLHAENVRIQNLIDEEFGKIDPDEWIRSFDID